jgi:chromate reductase
MLAYCVTALTSQPAALAGARRSPVKPAPRAGGHAGRDDGSGRRAPQRNAPEAYIQFVPGLITPDGEVTDETTEQFLHDFMAEFGQFILRVLTVLPRSR